MKLKESAVVWKVAQSGSMKPNVLLLSALLLKSTIHYKTKTGETAAESTAENAAILPVISGSAIIL